VVRPRYFTKCPICHWYEFYMTSLGAIYGLRSHLRLKHPEVPKRDAQRMAEDLTQKVKE